MAQQKARVYITDIINDDLKYEREVLDDVADVVALVAKNEDELIGRIDDADALIVWHFINIGPKVVEHLKKCKVIVRAGVGYENVDLKATRAAGIPVCNVPDYGPEEVADTALGMALGIARGLHFTVKRVQDRRCGWNHAEAAPVYRLRGKTYGIVGLGRIGTATAIRAKALGFNVMFYDPYIPDGYDKIHHITRAETLDELLSASYIVGIHCSATEETAGMINEKAIWTMPKGSILINTARGIIVEHEVIPKAIREGQLRGAGFDVFPIEPPPDDDVLLKAWRDPEDPCYDRVIISPHTAFYSEEGMFDLRVKTAQGCRRAIVGDRLRNVVN